MKRAKTSARVFSTTLRDINLLVAPSCYRDEELLRKRSSRSIRATMLTGGFALLQATNAPF
jgi:hypothetical protein